jgi:hypothetical protein
MDIVARKQQADQSHARMRAIIADCQERSTAAQIEAYKLEGEYRLLEELEREPEAPAAEPPADIPHPDGPNMDAEYQQFLQDLADGKSQQERGLAQAKLNMALPKVRQWTGPWVEGAPGYAEGAPEPISIRERFPNFFPEEPLPTLSAEELASTTDWENLKHV